MKGKFPVNRARRGGRTSCPASRSKAVGLTTRKHPRFFPVMPRNERVASGQFRRFHRSGTGTIEGGLVSGGEHAQPDLLDRRIKLLSHLDGHRFTPMENCPKGIWLPNRSSRLSVSTLSEQSRAEFSPQNLAYWGITVRNAKGEDQFAGYLCRGIINSRHGIWLAERVACEHVDRSTWKRRR